jgi:hypothetical protein
LFLKVHYHDRSYGGHALLKFDIHVRGADTFPVAIEFTSALWRDMDDGQHSEVPMKGGTVSLGNVEAQALAIALLLVASDKDSGPDWATQTLKFDVTGANYEFLAAQLPPRYVSAMTAAREAIRRVMESP